MLVCGGGGGFRKQQQFVKQFPHNISMNRKKLYVEIEEEQNGTIRCRWGILLLMIRNRTDYTQTQTKHNFIFIKSTYR